VRICSAPDYERGLSPIFDLDVEYIRRIIVGMIALGALVRETREAIGMSQTDLAVEGGVSLATVQNIEAGRANPSLSTINNVLEPLALTLSAEPGGADWNALAAMGLPLSGSTAVGPRSARSLRRHIQCAALELSRNAVLPDRERKVECLGAMLLAIHRHYPSRFRSWFRRSALIRDLLPARPDGRAIKLSRIALGPLSEIL
jgi:transcriptional regulator with XRE-family HTH domain